MARKTTTSAEQKSLAKETPALEDLQGTPSTEGGRGGAIEATPPENVDGLGETDFWVLPSDLADQLGVSLGDLSELLDHLPLADGLEKRNAGGSLEISKKGAARIQDHLGISVPIVLEKKEAAPLVTLFVRRIVRNKRMVLAVASAAEVMAKAGVQELRVEVRDNTNFTPGMVLEGCRHVQADLYHLAGRPPRRRGRW